MKSIILYSKETADFHHQAIKLPDGGHLFIRAEVIEDDPDFALDKASPQDGEIVLNSIPYPLTNRSPFANDKIKSHFQPTTSEEHAEDLQHFIAENAKHTHQQTNDNE